MRTRPSNEPTNSQTTKITTVFFITSITDMTVLFRLPYSSTEHLQLALFFALAYISRTLRNFFVSNPSPCTCII